MSNVDNDEQYWRRLVARTPLAISSIPVVPVGLNSTLNGGEEGGRRGG